MNAREVASSGVVIFCRFRTSFVFGFTHRRSRNLVRLGSGYRMTGRRTRLADTFEQRPHLSLRLLWSTPSYHNSASTLFVRISRDASASGNRVSNSMTKNKEREMTFAFSRRSSYVRPFL